MIPTKTLSFPLSPKTSSATSPPTSNTNPTCIFIVCHFKIPRKSISRRVQCAAVLLELLQFLSRACTLSAHECAQYRWGEGYGMHGLQSCRGGFPFESSAYPLNPDRYHDLSPCWSYHPHEHGREIVYRPSDNYYDCSVPNRIASQRSRRCIP